MRSTNMAAVALLLGIAGSACGQPVPRALLTTRVGNPLSVIPGTGGVLVSSFTQAQIGLSARGTHWTLAVNATGQPTTNDTFHMSGTAAGISHVVPEGVTLPGAGFAFIGRPNAQVAVNDSGDMAFKVTTNGPATSNEAVVRYNAGPGTYDVIALEGTPIPGVAGESFGGFLDSANIFNDGKVAFRAGGTSGGLPSDRDDFIFLSGSPQTTLEQAGTFAPANQLGGTSALLTSFNDEAYVSEDRSRVLIDGGLAGIGRAIVVDRRVVLQQGAPITGLGGEVATSGVVDEARMFAGGDWAAWGVGAGGTAFAIVNDSLYVREGDAVPGGLLGETIVSIGYMHINSKGDIAYSARTSASRDVIIVDGVALDAYVAVSTFNSTFSITDATQVDYDGDGLLDDAYFGFLNDDTVALSDAGELYFVGRFTSSETITNIGDALVVMQTLIPAPGAGAVLALAGLGVLRRRR